MFCGALGLGVKYLSGNENISISSEVSETDSVDNQEFSDEIKIYPTIKDVPNVPSGTFTYGGSICFAALEREGLNEAISKAHPQFELKYVEPEDNPNCDGSISQLLEKKLSFARIGRPLTLKEYELANNRGAEFESVVVGSDGIVFYVNKSLPIKSLSIDQLKGIYSDEITNWKELEISNLPIVPVSLDPENSQILKQIIQNVSTSQRVEIVRDHTSAIKKVASTPGAISYGSAAILRGQDSIRPIPLKKNSVPVSALLDDGSVNLQAFRLSNYPITRNLFVVIARDGSLREKAGVAYANFLLSQEGQEIIKNSGFVPKFWDWEN